MRSLNRRPDHRHHTDLRRHPWHEIIEGDLRREPYRIGKPLEEPFDGLHSVRRGTYRIIYRIVPDKHVVEITSIKHRRDAYRR